MSALNIPLVFFCHQTNLVKPVSSGDDFFKLKHDTLASFAAVLALPGLNHLRVEVGRRSGALAKGLFVAGFAVHLIVNHII